jgi:hypothetical protein
VIGAVELESLVEGSLLAEPDEGESLGFAIVSGEQFHVDDVTEGLEQLFDIVFIGLERESLNNDLVSLSFFFLLLFYLFLFFKGSLLVFLLFEYVIDDEDS